MEARRPTPRGANSPGKENRMELPLQITYHGTESTESLETEIRGRAEHLNRFHDKITSCRVVVDLPHQRHGARGNLFNVRIDLKVPGNELVVNREHTP